MKLKVTTLFLLFSLALKSQGVFDPYFYTSILNTYLKNPAYIGISDHPMATIVTHQGPAGGFLFGMAAQQNLDDIKSAMGGSYFYQSNTIESGISSTIHNLNAQYSHFIKINREVSFKPGLELGVVYQSIKISGFSLPINGTVSSTYFNATGGMVIFSKDFHLGISFAEKGIGGSKKNASAITQQSTFTSDLAVNIGSGDRENTWSLTPNVFFLQNQNLGITSAGATFRYLMVMSGCNLQLDNVGNFYYIPMLGFWDQYFRISLCYQHLTAKPPKGGADDYFELTGSFALATGGGFKGKKFTKLY